MSLNNRIKILFSNSGLRRYTVNTGWVFFSRIGSMAISFFATIFIVRNLGPENYGQLSYAISFVGLFSFISSFGIDPVLYRELVKNRDKRNELLGSGFFIKFVAGILSLILSIISAVLFATDDVALTLIIIISGTFIFNSFLMVGSEFQARVQSKYTSIISIVVILTLNILKVFVIIIGEGVIYLAAVLLFESVLNFILYWYAYNFKLKEHVSQWRVKRETVLLLFRDSWPLVFSAAFTLIYARVDQIFIKHMIDASAVGLYDAAVRIAETWYFIPGLIINSLFPAIVNARTTSINLYHTRFKNLGVFILLISVLIAVTNVLLAPFIINILYGKAFTGSITILQIYTWTVIAISIGSLISNYLLIENYRRIMFYTTFIPMMCNVVLNLLWIPQYGIVGSAYATLVSYFIAPLSLLLFKQTRSKLFGLFKRQYESIK